MNSTSDQYPFACCALARLRMMPKAAVGDFVLVADTGAYTLSMYSRCAGVLRSWEEGSGLLAILLCCAWSRFAACKSRVSGLCADCPYCIGACQLKLLVPSIRCTVSNCLPHSVSSSVLAAYDPL